MNLLNSPFYALPFAVLYDISPSMKTYNGEIPFYALPFAVLYDISPSMKTYKLQHNIHTLSLPYLFFWGRLGCDSETGNPHGMSMLKWFLFFLVEIVDLQERK